MTLGWDAAGIVEETGSDEIEFKKGNAVYGVPNFPGEGSYAEYSATKVNQIALKPKGIGFNKAARASVRKRQAFYTRRLGQSKAQRLRQGLIMSR